MKAWVHQDDKQVKKHGAEKVSWYVGWIDPEGRRRCKSCGAGHEGERNAEKVRKKIEAELLTGTYQSNSKKTWEDFRKEFETRELERLAVRSRPEVRGAFDHFEKLMKPGKVSAIKTTTMAEFAAKRRQEKGKKKGELVSPYTVNKDLRHLRAALRKAHRWGYIAAVPYFDLERESKKLATYMTPEHFAAIYQKCGEAKLPANLAYSAADWWRGLLVMAYMTGWRISELLAVRRDDVDLKEGTAITRENKGKREEKVKLHPVVVEHLKKLAGFDPGVFPWNHDRTTLMVAFMRIQEAAGVKLPCSGGHKHTRHCHVYGFHDIRRAFATMNADKLTPDTLQALMRHKSYTTTQVYINLARQMDAAVASLHVPAVLNKAKA